MKQNEFIENIKEFGIECNKQILNQLNLYYNLLVEWNNKMNLTAIIDEEDVYLKHFYDSLTLTKVINLNDFHSLCDIGTGAGFPGIVLKIFFPHLKITLVDSLNKRTIFLNEVIKRLELKDINVICARAEEYSINNREKFDIVTARAVSSLNVLLEYSIPLVKVNGYFIPLKGNAQEEIENSNNALKKLNCEIVEVEKFNLPKENSIRTIIKIFKKEKTDKLFPRKYSEIKKRPL